MHWQMSKAAGVVIVKLHYIQKCLGLNTHKIISSTETTKRFVIYFTCRLHFPDALCAAVPLFKHYIFHTHKHSGKFFDSMLLCVKSYCLLHTFDWHDCDPSCHLLVDFSINFHIVIHSRGTCIEWLIRKWWEVLEFSFIKNWKLHQACKMAVRQRANANLFYMEWKLLSFYSR